MKLRLALMLFIPILNLLGCATGTPITEHSSQSYEVQISQAISKSVGVIGSTSDFGSARTSILILTTIYYDGLIRDIEIAKSSGNEKLDLAIVSAIREGAPYKPFPQKVKAKYDVLQTAQTFEYDPSAGIYLK